MPPGEPRVKPTPREGCELMIMRASGLVATSLHDLASWSPDLQVSAEKIFGAGV
jgi:hypothetical protein